MAKSQVAPQVLGLGAGKGSFLSWPCENKIMC